MFPRPLRALFENKPFQAILDFDFIDVDIHFSL